MSTTTSVAINSATYTQVSNGSASVLVQGTGRQNFEVWVGTSAGPSPNSPATAGQVIDEKDGWAWSGSSLAGTDYVFVRACNPAGGSVKVVAS